jgi:hypothetical protein
MLKSNNQSLSAAANSHTNFEIVAGNADDLLRVKNSLRPLPDSLLR